jgi:hypothetical protein
MSPQSHLSLLQILSHASQASHASYLPGLPDVSPTHHLLILRCSPLHRQLLPERTSSVPSYLSLSIPSLEPFRPRPRRPCNATHTAVCVTSVQLGCILVYTGEEEGTPWLFAGVHVCVRVPLVHFLDTQEAAIRVIRDRFLGL